jgi:hypothetical protein
VATNHHPGTTTAQSTIYSSLFQMSDDEEEESLDVEQLRRALKRVKRARKEAREAILERNLTFLICSLNLAHCKICNEQDWDCNNADQMPAELVDFSEDQVKELKNIISDFEQQDGNKQGNGSIDKLDSVRNLWKNIIIKLRGMSFNRDHLRDQLRIVYEWPIREIGGNMERSKAVYIDFSAISANMPHLNFVNLAGALECGSLGVTDGSEDKESKSEESDLLRPQAISRAAYCVYARWLHQDRKGNHRSSCFFADSNGIGVVRVSLTDGSLYVETIYPKALPGIDVTKLNTSERTITDGLTTDYLVLRLFAHMLHSSPNSVPALSSKPPPYHDATRGINQFNTLVEWTTERVIGSGEFGVMMSVSGSKNVIKLGNVHRSNLYEEVKAIERLNSNNNNASKYFPVLLDYLRSTSENKVIALKFSLRGIPLSTLVSEIISNNTLQHFCSRLIIHVGVNLINALKIAHTAGVWHQDLRPSNIIIIPNNDSEYEASMEVLDSGIEPIPRLLLETFTLERSTVMLNDWGLAELDHKDKSKNISRNLVKAIENVVFGLFLSPNLEDFGRAENECLSVIFPKDAPTIRVGTVEQAANLKILAQDCKYDEVVTLIQNLSFQM